MTNAVTAIRNNVGNVDDPSVVGALLMKECMPCLQCINDITFVLPSIYILAKDCSWFDPFVW
jgi:hypothetical protein